MNRRLSPYSVLQTIATDAAIWHPFWKLTTAIVTHSYSLIQPLGEASQMWHEEHRTISFELWCYQFPACADRCQHLLDQGPDRNNRGIPKHYAKLEVLIAIGQCKRCLQSWEKAIVPSHARVSAFSGDIEERPSICYNSRPPFYALFTEAWNWQKRPNFQLYFCSVSLYQ